MRPPLYLLVLGAAAVVVGAALLFASGLFAHVLGYLFSSIVAIALVGLFHRVDLERRQDAMYEPQPALSRVAGVVAALGVVVAAVHTWSIATQLAK